MREQFPPPFAREAFGPWGRGGFGEFPPGWGPGGGHGGRGFGGPHRGHGPRGHGGRRGRRGDVRAAILALLAERPMHGYEMIQEINERSGGFWTPSPGSVYPTLQLLTDEGLVNSKEESGKRMFELSEEGRATAKQQDNTPPWEHIAGDADPNEVKLREATGNLMAATMQVSKAGSSAQRARAADAIDQARRAIYAILGEVDSDDSNDEE